MSTTTNYYALTKPELSDPADIRAINGNMDTLDTVLHGSQVSLADAFDQTKAYSAGDVVMYQFYMYKFTEDKAAGNWDATKVERTTAAETGGGEVDFDLYGEASGNPASFADGSESALVECEVEFEPKQNLHGYDKPWAGGVGKNLIPLTLSKLKAANTSGIWADNVYTNNNIMYEINMDNAGNVQNITVNGTASNNSVLYLYETNEVTLQANTDYYLNGTPTGGGANKYRMYFENTASYDSGEGTTYTPTATYTDRVRLVVYRGFNAQNLVFRPMMTTGRQETFEPYTNICPIEGYDEITINVSPTNDTSQGVDTTIQLGDTYYSGTLNAVTGELVIDKIFVEMDDVTWTALDSSGNKYRYYTDIVGMKKMAVRSMDILCSCYETNMGGGSWDDNTIWNSTNLNRVIVVTSQYQTANAFMASLTDQTMLVDMETPLVIQIPPTTINTLLGQNYVSSEDTEDIDLVYVKATAPIKPNPSGEADGYLSSIDLNGVKFEIIKELPTVPTSDGNYKLKLSVSSGVPTLSWVSDT